MAVITKISWTEHTWNPWRGCTKVSTNLKTSYVLQLRQRYGHDPDVVVKTKTLPAHVEKCLAESKHKG